MRRNTLQKTYERFAFAVQNGRKREKITQTELAERLHMSIRTIQDIENQKINPKFETIILICKELNINLDAVIFPENTNTYLSKTFIDLSKTKIILYQTKIPLFVNTLKILIEQLVKKICAELSKRNSFL